jgi:hypothetical protein
MSDEVNEQKQKQLNIENPDQTQREERHGEILLTM